MRLVCWTRILAEVAKWVGRSFLLGLVLTLLARPSSAYRPFDGTDAAVIKEGEVEIELQPAGIWREGKASDLIAPATRLNYGISNEWEAVLEGQLQTRLTSSEPSTLTASGAFLKGVLHPGSLQGKEGLSIATEFGVLLPDSRGEAGFGASMAWIVSQRWEWGAVHFNVATGLTRKHNSDLFLSTILEGPLKWKVRPVAEMSFEQEFTQHRTLSGLVGLIWQVRDDLSFDFALRHAVTNHVSVDEVRAGMTFSFPLRVTERWK